VSVASQLDDHAADVVVAAAGFGVLHQFLGEFQAVERLVLLAEFAALLVRDHVPDPVAGDDEQVAGRADVLVDGGRGTHALLLEVKIADTARDHDLAVHTFVD